MRRYERAKLGDYSGLHKLWRGLGQEEVQAKPAASPEKLMVTKQQARLGMLAAIVGVILLTF